RQGRRDRAGDVKDRAGDDRVAGEVGLLLEVDADRDEVHQVAFVRVAAAVIDEAAEIQACARLHAEVELVAEDDRRARIAQRAGGAGRGGGPAVGAAGRPG